jgi:hypothetical protein
MYEIKPSWLPASLIRLKSTAAWDACILLELEIIVMEYIYFYGVSDSDRLISVGQIPRGTVHLQALGTGNGRESYKLTALRLRLYIFT